ncbi:CHAT domain-containing protein [Phormidesmis sp. 146-35]
MTREVFPFFRHLRSTLTRNCFVLFFGFTVAFLCVVTHPFLLQVNAEVPISETLVEQSKQRYETGQYTDAIALLQRAISAYRQQGDSLKQAMSLSNLALSHQQLGQWNAANQAIAESLRLLQNRPSSVLAQTLEVQGQLQLVQGQTESALSTWEQSEKVYIQINDSAGVIRSRLNQCYALRVLGFYRRAQTILQELQQTLDRQPDSITKVIALRSLGNALARSADLANAERILQESLKVAIALKSDKQITATQLSLGNVARLKKDIQTAIAAYEKVAQSSLPLMSIQGQLNLLSLRIENQQKPEADNLVASIQHNLLSLPSSRTKCNAQINFAQSLAKLNAYDEAARVLVEVIQQAQTLKDRRSESYALGSLGILYQQQQQWASAEKVTRRAIALIENANANDIGYRWYSQLGLALVQQGKDREAISAYTIAINMLDELRKDLVDVNRDLQFSFKENVEPTYRRLVELLLKRQNQDETGKNLERARNLIEALQVAELDNFFREACLNTTNVLIDEVVDRDNPTTAIIYPIILENELQVLVKAPQQKTLKQYRIAKKQQQVEQVLKSLQDFLPDPDRTSDIKRLSQEVYSWLVAPFEQEFKGKVTTLVFVLDGAFRNVPMSVLYNGEQYLIEQGYAIATNLGLSLQSPKPISKSPLRVLAAGLAQPSGQFANTFSALPNIPAEIDAIRQAGIPVTELKNQNFTTVTFSEKVKEAPYNVIHMATHGQFSSQAEDTFLLANDNKINVRAFDQLIRDRAQTQRTAIDLLVLSACETAAGDNRATLGLAGVAIKAGAQSTIASLWKVQDSSTAVLIGEFYRELKTGQVSKAEALRRAQLKLLKQYPNFAQPLYWAPFILVGNWL